MVYATCVEKMWHKRGGWVGKKKMKKQKNLLFHLLVLEAPNSQETRGLLVHATSDFQDNNKDK